MKRSQYSHLSLWGCKPGILVLAFAFGTGLLLGSTASAGAHSVFAGSRQALTQSAGISALIPGVLPLLFSGLAVYAKRPVLLIPLAFWKAFFFSYVAFGLIAVWGSAGWLVCILALFGSSSSLGALWWYWLRHIGGEGFSSRTFFPAFGAILLIGWVDIAVISPFLTNILIFYP